VMGSLQDLNRVRIIVHGGAWNIPDEKVKASRAGVEHAARRGYLALLRGQSAVDAVEEAVKVMENDEAFDAGIGSCLNSIGEVELDAMISKFSKTSLLSFAMIPDIFSNLSCFILFFPYSATSEWNGPQMRCSCWSSICSKSSFSCSCSNGEESTLFSGW